METRTKTTRQQASTMGFLKLHWLRFSLGAMLAWVAIIAVILAVANLVSDAIYQHSSVRTLVRLGAYVAYDDGSRAIDQDLTWDTFWYNTRHRVTTVAFRVMPDLFPETGFLESNPSAEHLHLVAKFNRLTTLGLSGCEVTDDDIRLFIDLSLEKLDLTHTLVTDKGMCQLAKITTLKALYLQSGVDLFAVQVIGSQPVPQHRLRGPRITDAGVQCLTELPVLETLDLAGSGVSNDCVGYLSRITTLRTLNIQRTYVLHKGVAALKKANPQLDVLESL